MSDVIKNKFLFEVGTRGRFKFLDPIGKFIDSNKEYTISSVSTIDLLINERIDVYNIIYKPYGLNMVDFKNDLETKIPIIGLLTTGNKLFYVPAKYIVEAPLTDGVYYTVRGITIKLEPNPTDENIEMYIPDIKDKIKSLTGLECDVKVVDLSKPYIVDYNVDKDNKARRGEKMTYDLGTDSRIKELVNTIEELKFRLKTLADRTVTLEDKKKR